MTQPTLDPNLTELSPEGLGIHAGLFNDDAAIARSVRPRSDAENVRSGECDDCDCECAPQCPDCGPSF
jgi:hypothetical protein